jgi:cytochrome c oxidase subunit 3
MSAPMLALESGQSRSDKDLATFGVLTLAVAVLMAFGALFGAWLSLRSGTPVWPPKGVARDNYLGSTLGITMLLASAVAEWAVYGVRRRERGQAVTGYVLLIVLGLAFLNLLSYSVHLAHFGPGTHAYGAVYFAFNILMAATIVTAVAIALVTLARLLGGQVSSSEPTLARAAAWFWHAATTGWIVLYLAVYVVK